MIDSFRFGDSYRISELCDLVAPDQVQYGYLFYCWSQYDRSNPLLTHHSNHLLTHSLTIGKKIESPRRSLWGLITHESGLSIIAAQVNLCEGEEGLNIGASFKYPLVSWYPDQDVV